MNPFQSKNQVFLIAEIGGNHEGDFQYARELTQLAINSGADAIKFQIYTGDSLVNRQVDHVRNQHFKKFELSKDQYLNLAEICREHGKIFMASVWDMNAFDWIDPFIPIYKIGSGDLTATSFLRRIASTGKPIILSTGLTSMQEVEQAVRTINECDQTYLEHKKLALLQCTSLYPNNDSEVNLNAMLTLKQQFDLPVGYSDHTTKSIALEVAVSMGASILEFHFTDTRENKVFRDHFVSLTQSEVGNLIERIQLIKLLQGSATKEPTKNEIESGHSLSFRRALYPVKDLEKGQIVSASDLVSLRPLKGICASYLDEIAGKKAPKSLKAFESLGDIKEWK